MYADVSMEKIRQLALNLFGPEHLLTKDEVAYLYQLLQSGPPLQ
jgi:hypothetical protein